MLLRNNDVDIFCKIIDNFGDAGFSFRFAVALKQHQPDRVVRLFIDELTTLHALVPELDLLSARQLICGVELICLPFVSASDIRSLHFAPLVIESLACEIPEPFKSLVYTQSQLIVTLEHLTAEREFQDLHGLSVPTGGDIPRYLFAQGFTPQSGGILIEDSLSALIRDQSNSSQKREKFLAPFQRDLPANALNYQMGSLFSYDRDMLPLISTWQALPENHLVFVLGRLAQDALKRDLEECDMAWLNKTIAQCGNCFFLFPGMFSWRDYDDLLFSLDYNFVRGEDSLARAILAGKPFLWHSYPQEADHQLVKVEALLDVMSAYQTDPLFLSYRQLMLDYNTREAGGNPGENKKKENYYSFFQDFAKIRTWVNCLRESLIQQGGVIPRLEQFIKLL